MAHSRQHAHDSSHPLALDLSRLALYCHTCGDYAYSQATEGWIRAGSAEAESRKRRREHDQAALLSWLGPAAALVREKSRFIGRDPMAGLRGMYNLGNTCYVSVVLQSLLHNPLLRNYFLADCHNRERCLAARRAKQQQLRASTPTGSSAAASSVCLACDLDELFSSFYSGDHSPHVPDHMLLSLWSYADHLAGYAQQDAHELLMALVDGVHEGCRAGDAASAAAAAAAGQTNGPTGALPSPSPSPSPSPTSPCPCIVHRVFGGTLRSDVSCNTCRTISTALDAILDMSVDVVPHAAATPAAAATLAPPLPLHPQQPPPPPVAAGRGGASVSLNLVDCLSRFTRVEKLYNKDKFFCSKVRCARCDSARCVLA